ncbi:hypothetical protein HMI54_009019 [Coelomomyces lativittatus]|nr:hypothetical protein HMI56_004534 [Coelomomyces lativittatus]KAJ1518396.1 hypothetical protein HMI55_004701 [Coelomomyces lativittatus]KAJ1518739.1 hypothetical protein HMI54_009019 [Coelomomyces lativittatus]
MPRPDLPLFDNNIQDLQLENFLKHVFSDPVTFPQSIWRIEHVEQALNILDFITPPSHSLPETNNLNSFDATSKPYSSTVKKTKQFSKSTVALLLDFLKMLGKIETIYSPFYEVKTVNLLYEFAGVNAVEHPEVGAEIYDSAISQRSLQILNNILLLNRSKIDTLANPRLLKGLILFSKKDHLSVESLFLIFRLLFLFSSTGTLVSQLEDYGGISSYAQCVQRILSDDKREQPIYVNAICEILKTLFNFLQHGIRAKDLLQPNLICSILYQFSLYSEWPMSPPHSHAIHALLFDPTYLWCTKENVSFICLNILDPCLDNLLTGLPSKPNIENENSILPLFHLLINTAKHEPSLLKEILTPPDPKPRLTENLLKLFTCIELPRLKQCAEELMSALFRDNMPELVEYTGIGPVAGMLVNRNLFTPEVLSKLKLSADPNEEDLAWKSMSMEEREREAEKIFKGLERLKQLGFITPVHPTSSQPIEQENISFESDA